MVIVVVNVQTISFLTYYLFINYKIFFLPPMILHCHIFQITFQPSNKPVALIESEYQLSCYFSSFIPLKMITLVPSSLYISLTFITLPFLAIICALSHFCINCTNVNVTFIATRL